MEWIGISKPFCRSLTAVPEFGLGYRKDLFVYGLIDGQSLRIFSTNIER